MIRILHLLDASTGWEQRLGVTHLMDRLPRDRYEHVLAALHPSVADTLGPIDAPIHLLRRFPPFDVLTAPSVVRLVHRLGVNLIHAWSPRAAMVARAVSKVPLVVQLYDPVMATHHAKRLRVIAQPTQFAIACSSGIVRRRLIESGVPAESAVVIRPGIDFGLINRVKGSALRAELGLNDANTLVTLPEPVSRDAGHQHAFYAVSLHQHFRKGWVTILPGNSKEIPRLRRFGQNLPLHAPCVTPGSRVPFENLISISDYLLVTSPGDVSTTCIAWAMAAGVHVIASAGYAVAELISTKVNGLLFKHRPGRFIGSDIIRLLQDRPSHIKTAETARGQAYEVFGLRRYAEQTMQLYDNVMSGKPPETDLVDSAVAM